VNTVNVEALEVPPHGLLLEGVHPLGAGVETVTGMLATEAMSPAPIAAVSPLIPTNVVVRALPFHCTVEQGSRLLPFTSSENATPPAAVLEGTSELIAGSGRDVGAVMVNVSELEVIAELDTVTLAVPSEAVSASVMAAVSCELLTNVVTRGEPFQFTTLSLVNAVPLAAFTVSVNPAALQYGVVLAEVVDAESDAMDSPEIVNEIAGLDVPPPGVGVNTVTGTVATVVTSDAGMTVVSCVGLR
jgi:hypothetical protein